VRQVGNVVNRSGVVAWTRPDSSPQLAHMRQLKFIINNGVEADLKTAQAFEMLSGGLTAAVNGGWQIPDCDQGAGVANFATKGDLWQTRRTLAKDFWTQPSA
jgi:enoyl-CoA hydratase